MSITNNNIRLTEHYETIRPAAVAGMFYPADPDELRQSITCFLDEAKVKISAPKAIIAPHAGYIYSGSIAATAYASLRSVRQQIKKVVLLGPAHTVYLHGLALPNVQAFATPLGNIPVAQDLVDRIKGLSQVVVMESAHSREHSLEVHLPFLQTVLNSFTLLPLVVGESETSEVSQVLEAVWGGNETLIVISSDLSHYHDYETARHIDSSTSEAIQALQLDKIGPHQACGCFPMRGLLQLAKDKDMSVNILDMRNSGDTAGPHDRVVGYGAYSLHDPQVLSEYHRKQLRDIAHQSIEQGFESRQPLQPDLMQYDPVLRENRATFVTLNIKGQLRGCIGTTEASVPLISSIAESAFNAAFRDPRFQLLTPAEYKQVDLSISVLSPPVEVDFSSDAELLENLRPGIDGLIIAKDACKATFLPEVWDAIPEPEVFLAHLKQKARIKPADSLDKAWCYQTEHF